MSIPGAVPAAGDTLARVTDGVRHLFQNGASQASVDTLQAAVDALTGSTSGFSAHKNGTNQTGIATLTYTKLTMGTEIYDVGSYYDAANSRWTPPAGAVLMSAAVYWNANCAAGDFVCSIHKNGSPYKIGLATNSGAGTWGANVTVHDVANGTDYYEVFAFGATASTLTVSGLASATYFMGWVL